MTEDSVAQCICHLHMHILHDEVDLYVLLRCKPLSHYLEFGPKILFEELEDRVLVRFLHTIAMTTCQLWKH